MNREQMEILDLMHKLPDKELCQMIGYLGNMVSERLRIETYLKEKYFDEQTAYKKIGDEWRA